MSWSKNKYEKFPWAEYSHEGVQSFLKETFAQSQGGTVFRDRKVKAPEGVDHPRVVYSDRIWQSDPKKHDRLRQKHFGDRGQRWDNDPKKIEAFLKDFFGEPELKLKEIIKGTNKSNGFPYWIFKYYDK